MARLESCLQYNAEINKYEHIQGRYKQTAGGLGVEETLEQMARRNLLKGDKCKQTRVPGDILTSIISETSWM